jgi:hypothetical protein
MSDCEQITDKLLSNLHYLVVYSNFFYLLAGIYGLFVSKFLPGKMSLFILFLSILFILTAIISTIYHGTKGNFIGYLDTVLAVFVSVYSIIIVVYLLYYKKVNLSISFLLLIISLIGLYLFYLDKSKKFKDTSKVKGIFGPIYKAVQYTEITKEENNYRLIMRNVFHTLWHILSGFTACVIILSIKI